MSKVVMSKRRIVLILIILLTLIIIFALTTYYFYRNNKLISRSNTSVTSQTEARALAAKVGILMVLPTDEIPTVATVSDPEALKNQTFFIDAKVGDKVLIYTNAKKAILYDPALNKIITVAPLNINDQKSGTSSSTSKSPDAISPSKVNKF